MRIIDAPQAGWYPDPDGRERLRWWDGLDWTDIRRAPPSTAELTRAEANLVPEMPVGQSPPVGQQYGGYTRQDTQEIIAEVRTAARQEFDRAANEFSERANTAVRSFTPLITEYTSKLFRWVKSASLSRRCSSLSGWSFRRLHRRVSSTGSATASTTSPKKPSMPCHVTV